MINLEEYDHKDLKLSLDKWNSDEWLSLNHFPDDTKINLTERGRKFIFSSSSPPAKFHGIIDKTKWLRFKSTKEEIPLSIIRTILNGNSKELFISSFMVTGVGSQKVQLPLHLPIRVNNSAFPRLLALMCLSRGIFVSGAFQSKNEEKTEAFIKAFSEVFGVSPEISVNKRGYYTKITEQVAQAIVFFMTEKEVASVPEIIASVGNLHEDDIIEFLTTWLKFARLYYHEEIDHPFLFEFRVNEETKSIVKLLSTCKIEWRNGSKNDNGQLVPVYCLCNTVENKAILNLDTKFKNKDKLRRELLEEISQLRASIEQKNARLEMMENIIEELNDELEEAKEKAKKVRYSKYYYENRSRELKQKCEELSRLKNEIQEENVHLKKVVKQTAIPSIAISEEEIPFSIPNSSKHQKTDEKDSKGAFQSVLEELDSFAEDELRETANKRTRMKFTIEKEVLEERQSNLSSRMLSKELLRQLLLLLAIPENWILVLLSRSEKNLTQIRSILDYENSAQLRRSIAHFEELGILEKSFEHGETKYSLNVQEILRIVEDRRARATRTENPADIRHYIKTIIPR